MVEGEGELLTVFCGNEAFSKASGFTTVEVDELKAHGMGLNLFVFFVANHQSQDIDRNPTSVVPALFG